MALGLPSGGAGGDRSNILKYDARAGRLFRVDRSNASGTWVSENVEVTSGFQAVMDLEQIETGWLHFPKGAAPDIRTVPLGQPMPDKPTDQHKTGFKVMMKLGKSFAADRETPDVREMAANAGVSIAGMDALHDAYTKGLKDNPGKLPIVTLEKTVARVSSGQGQTSTNYEPVWAITGWTDRPKELPLRGHVAPPVAANEGKAAPVQQAVTTSQVKAEPATGSGEEF